MDLLFGIGWSEVHAEAGVVLDLREGIVRGVHAIAYQSGSWGQYQSGSWGQYQPTIAFIYVVSAELIVCICIYICIFHWAANLIHAVKDITISKRYNNHAIRLHHMTTRIRTSIRYKPSERVLFYLSFTTTSSRSFRLLCSSSAILAFRVF